jgi:transcriptional regulator with XRE-family HTH domain
MTFGEYLSVERRRHEFSQAELAEVTGLHRTHIVRMETGSRSPLLETVVVLARGFGLTPAELVGRWWSTV